MPTEFGRQFEADLTVEALRAWSASGRNQEAFMETEEVCDVLMDVTTTLLRSPSVGLHRLELRSPSAVATDLKFLGDTRGSLLGRGHRVDPGLAGCWLLRSATVTLNPLNWDPFDEDLDRNPYPVGSDSARRTSLSERRVRLLGAQPVRGRRGCSSGPVRLQLCPRDRP